MCVDRLRVTRRRRSLLEQLDPAVEARERRAELMRRLARHARPDALALGVAARANDVDAGEQEQHERSRRLQRGNDAQPVTSGVSPKWIVPTTRVDDRRVLPVELAHVAPRSSSARRAARSNGRFAVCGRPPVHDR